MELGDRAAFRGWMHAADVIGWEPGAGDDWRSAGYTSAYVFPDRGLVQGHAALIASTASFVWPSPMRATASVAQGAGHPA